MPRTRLLARTKLVAQVSLGFVGAFAAAVWGGAGSAGEGPTPDTADKSALLQTVRRPEWVRSEVATGPPAPGRPLLSSRGANGPPERTTNRLASALAQDGSGRGVFGRPLDSSGSPGGAEFPVNSYTTSSQANPAVVADKKGNVTVIWQSGLQDGDSYGVFGRRFDPDGDPLGTEFQVNTYTTAEQRFPAVAADKKGNLAVFWESTGQDGSDAGIFGRRFDPDGDPLGTEFQVNTFTTDAQSSPAVAADKKGNLAVFWRSYGQDGSGNGIFGRRFEPTGAPLGPEFQVNTYTTDEQEFPTVAADKNGNLAVFWRSSGQDGDGNGIFGRRFDPTGAPLGPEFQVNTYTTDAQSNPGAVADKKGNVAVFWSSDGQDGSSRGIFGRRFDPAGSPLGPEFPVNTYTTGSQATPAPVVDKKGNLTVFWSSDGQDGSDDGIFGRRFDPTGVPLGTEFQVNTYTTGDQFTPAASVDGKGRFIVTWAGV